MSRVLCLCLCLAIFFQAAQSQGSINWTTSPFVPTAIPLAVRSPYLNLWLPAGNTKQLGDLSSQDAAFWNGNYQPVCGAVKVDGQSYTWMGTPGACTAGKAEQQSVNVRSKYIGLIWLFMRLTCCVVYSISIHFYHASWLSGPDHRVLIPSNTK